MPKEVLLCPPTHYDVVYQINPWMDTSIPVDRDKAMQEYNGLKKMYRDLGVNVNEINQAEGLPDMIYTANYGSVHKDKKLFIKANFKHDERKGEAELAKQFFIEQGYTIAELPKDIDFEGQGDLLKAGDLYILGHGKRTDSRAKGPLAEILGVPEKEILDLQMITDHYYHVDTALGPLDDPHKRTVVINPKAFSDEDLAKIHRAFDDVIDTNDQDNNVLGCNLVSVGQKVVVAKGISEELKTDLRQRDFEPIEVPMTESLKGGGAVKCNTLEYY